MTFAFCTTLIAVLMIAAASASPAASPAPRSEIRFDSDWKFLRGDDPGASKAGFNDAGWRRVDLPHDWSIEDLPTAEAGLPRFSLVPGTWRFKPGDDMAWKEVSFDDTSWQEVKLPAHWSEHSNYRAQNAFAWYRRKFTVPADLKGKDVVFLIGKVDDVDETFVNGVKIGGLGELPPSYSTAWEIVRRYRVPASLLKGDGTDVIAVRDYNGDGDAGIYAAPTAGQQSGPFDPDSEGGTAQGYTVGGIGWYRKSFIAPDAWKRQRVGIRFDGVYMNSEIWLNGERIGEHPYGYTSFFFDLTPHLRFGKTPNILAVKVDASGRTSRWYSGAGIYRHVWLTVTARVHVAPWGICVTMPQVSEEAASIHVRTSVENSGASAVGAAIRSRLVDPAGVTVGTGTVKASIQGSGTIDQDLRVIKPQLWSPSSPVLYRLVTTILVGSRPVDEVSTLIGIRTFTFDAENGFRINGHPLKLRGGCVHHDNGCLGSCTYDRAEERRVELLKASRFNAIRTSHNPPSPGFLDACDRLGMIVMDEAFDCWQHGKNGQDYGRFFDLWWKRDLESMVLRDRNHPSVALWSIGNEIPEQQSDEGAVRAGMLADFVRQLDPTRPVAQATNPDANKLDPLLDHLDVTGYNYASGRFASDHARHPQRVFAQTESFPQACFDSWMAIVDHTYAIGDFVWTAFDYLGEAGLGKTVPQSIPPGYTDDRLWTVSNCGDIDLTGFKRPPSYYRNAVWGVGPKIAAFVQALGPDGKPERVEGWGWTDERASWTWPGMEGKSVTVRVYSSLPQVRLILNGKDLGIKDTNRNTRFTATWDVPYEPGELVAEGLESDARIADRWVLHTAGPPAGMKLSPDRLSIAADGQDLSYVTVEIVDADGRLNPNADNLVHFTVTGPGRILGVCSADPRSVESFQQPQRKAFRGRCLVVIKAGEQPGSIRLKASADGLREADVMLETAAPPGRQ